VRVCVLLDVCVCVLRALHDSSDLVIKCVSVCEKEWTNVS